MARKLNEAELSAFMNALAREASSGVEWGTATPWWPQVAKEDVAEAIREELSAWLFGEPDKRSRF